MAETVFKEVRYDLQSLAKFIELGEIGLPDLQRPFVWKNAKIRDLFDSMYRGYPVGYLLFWQNSGTDDSHGIGVEGKQKPPRLLIVDGQQRLTSLYAVIKGVPVVRENYDSEKIEIAFNPLNESFEVADAAVRRDKAFLPNISELWTPEADLFEVVDGYIEGLESTRGISSVEKKAIRQAIQKVQQLVTFPFTALELAADVTEEQVAEVFVRINSKGKPLNQSDFILTLMSVFWDSGRKALEDFCRSARTPSVGKKSAFNYHFQPDPDHLLRVGVGMSFRRARLQHVYNILRGKDLETGDFGEERRQEQFGRLQTSQEKVLNLQYWHDFFKAVQLAGYRGGKMIGSTTAVVQSYTLYLIGRTEFKIEEPVLRRAIAEWFFMSSITGRYSASPESQMEQDLARLRALKDGAGFLAVLSSVAKSTLTRDFWEITLPNDLASSSARSPALFAYYASLNMLDAPALYSSNRVSDLLDPWIQAPRAGLERHHLFPKAFLRREGVTGTKDTNQAANYALLEWGDNGKVSDMPPVEYVPEMESRFSKTQLLEMYRFHALPDGWQELKYEEFLKQRRELMAGVIREAYSRLESPAASDNPEVPSVDALVSQGETDAIEFKSTLRRNLHTGKNDPRMEMAVLKTIAGFLNASGGTLVVGVSDNGEAVGIEADDFANEDKMNLHMMSLIRDRIGSKHNLYLQLHFEDFEDKRVLKVHCMGARSPAFVKDGGAEKFFVRTSAATSELSGSQQHDYVAERFA